MQPKRFPRLRKLGMMMTGMAAIYMGLTAYENRDLLFRTFVMPAMRLLPAETTHNLAVMACKYRIYSASNYTEDYNLHTSFFGRPISNPIGIAAGFDRNAQALLGLKDVGFGFIEIGSVTPMAQKGNPKPRIFRLSEDQAIISRQDCDNDGHQVVMQRLRKVLDQSDFKTVVGINLGSNRSSTTPTRDYVSGVKTFGPLADYLVVNAINPRSGGQHSVENKKKLIEILTAVNQARTGLNQKRKVPILLKLSPDLTLNEMKEIAAVISLRKCRVDGLIVSNTTSTRENLSDSKLASESGGLSGPPLRQRSTRLIAQMYDLTKGSIPIIGVGGISSGRDAFEKIEAGASFVQIYTAFVYEGPDLVDRIKEDLSQRISEAGFANIRDAVGSNYKQYLPIN